MYFECYGTFGKYTPEMLLLKYEIILKDIPSGGTKINSE